MPRKLTNEEYALRLMIKNPNIEALEEYKTNGKKIWHKCKVCGYRWKVRPSTLLLGCGCPVCATPPKAIGPAPEYKNSIWASKYKEYFSQYMIEEQMKTIMPNSGKKINIICPDCGNIKSISPNTLLSYGLGCRCGDGVSFPNKFVYNVLMQLNINVVTEYIPSWNKHIKYDDYLTDYNIIIENHGAQHYRQSNFSKLSGKTLQEEQDNDTYKKNIALKNNINDYIIIDCRYSDMTYIKNSIMHSSLPQILNFSQDDIDWKAAEKYACCNLIKVSADLYKRGESLKDIASKLNKSVNCIWSYIKKAETLGWCVYKNNIRNKGVYCIEYNILFDSLSSASQLTGISYTCINNNLTGRSKSAGRREDGAKLHWLKYSDAVSQKYIIDETRQNDYIL